MPFIIRYLFSARQAVEAAARQNQKLSLVALEIVGQSQFRQRIDQPFGRIEMIPLGAVAIVSEEHVMVVMVALSKRNERDPPTVTATITSSMRLLPPHMAN